MSIVEVVTWVAEESGPCANPVTDVRFGDGPMVSTDRVQAVIEHCAEALALLERIDPARFDVATVAAWAKGVEQLRRQADAAAIAVADHLDAAQPFRDHGFFTAKAWMKHHLQLSGSEAHVRVQEAKLRRAAQVWNNALGRWTGRRRPDPGDGPDRRQPAHPRRRPHRRRVAVDVRCDGRVVRPSSNDAR